MFPSEECILSRIKERNVRSMLDIGIGAGRTTRFFAPAVERYVGIDVAPRMVAEARRLSETLKIQNATFLEGNAIDLAGFSDRQFDFVFFSYNGIDSIPLDYREQAILSMRRVLGPGGLLAFSTHDARFIDRLYQLSFHLEPRKWPEDVLRWMGMRVVNGPRARYRRARATALRDGVHFFFSEIVYVDPQFQAEQLRNFGAVSVEGISSLSSTPYKFNHVPEVIPWLYYLVTFD